MLRSHSILFRVLLFLVLLLGLSTCAEVSDEVILEIELSGAPDTKVELGSVVKITIFAESSAALDFDYDWRPSEFDWSIGTRASLIKQKNTALFTWDPTGADVLSDDPISITFIATDKKGRRAEKTVTFRVAFGEGGPEFISSVSELYDPRSKKPVRFKVKIKHPACSIQDCVDIELDENSAPVGSSFERDSPLGGTFTWTPLPEQLTTRVHKVTFTANDGDSPIVSHEVSIVIRSNSTQIANPKEDDLCPAEQILSHIPLGPKRGLTDDYQLELDTMAGRFDEVVVYWALGHELDAAREVFSSNLVASGGHYTGLIPSIANDIDPDIGALNIDYQICGLDAGAEGDAASICIPAFGLYSFVASLPDSPACVDDAHEPNDTPLTTSAVGNEKWEYFHGCAGNVDYIRTESFSEEESTMVFVYNLGAQIDIIATDQEGNNIPVNRSPCTGAAFVDTSTTSTGGFFNFKVSGNNVPFRARKRILSGGPGNCIDEMMEPNDSGPDATPVASGDTLNAEICTPDEIDVYKIDVNAGENLRITTQFSNALGDLDMSLFAEGDSANIVNGFGIVGTFSTDDEELLEWRVLVSGTFYLKVENTDDTRNSYSIAFEIDQAPPCDTDMYSAAGNHSQASGTFLTTPGNGILDVENLEICPDQADWYKRTEFVGVPLNGSLSASNIDVISWRLVDLEGNTLDTASIVGGKLEFSFTPPQTMPIFHEITTTAEADYSFRLSR